MRILAPLRRLPVQILIFLIELYRTYVSPMRMPVCRFTPTCSEYAVTALRTRGLFIGLGLTAVRLAKCAPWHPGGWDPVPEPKRKRAATEAAAIDPQQPDSNTPVSSPVRAGICCETSAAAEHRPYTGSPGTVNGDTTDGST